jgi:DNA repair protein RadC
MLIDLSAYDSIAEPVRCPDDAVAILREAALNRLDAVDRDKEHFWVLGVDSAHRVRYCDELSVGTVNSSIVHPAEAFRRAVGKRYAAKIWRSAIANRVTAVIFAHNHPSQTISPSREDIVISRRLAKAGTILGIEVMDFLIITDAEFRSFKEAGYLGS